MIYVTVDQNDLNKVFNALDKVKLATEGVAETMLRQWALLTSATLKKNILQQTYGSFGNPHSDSWTKRKGSDTYWRQTDALVNSILSNKFAPSDGSNIAYFAGVPAGAMNGLKEIVEYAFSLEYGYSPKDIPSRPLFHKTMDDLMPYYFEKFVLARSMIFEVWS